MERELVVETGRKNRRGDKDPASQYQEWVYKEQPQVQEFWLQAAKCRFCLDYLYLWRHWYLCQCRRQCRYHRRRPSQCWCHDRRRHRYRRPRPCLSVDRSRGLCPSVRGN